MHDPWDFGISSLPFATFVISIILLLLIAVGLLVRLHA